MDAHKREWDSLHGHRGSGGNGAEQAEEVRSQEPVVSDPSAQPNSGGASFLGQGRLHGMWLWHERLEGFCMASGLGSRLTRESTIHSNSGNSDERRGRDVFQRAYVRGRRSRHQQSAEYPSGVGAGLLSSNSASVGDLYFCGQRKRERRRTGFTEVVVIGRIGHG